MNIDTATLHLLSLQRRLPVRTETDRDTFKALEMAIKALYQLSDISALSENKGEWIADIDKWGDVVTTVNGYTCSKCGTFNSDKDNFCPNCGADMRGEHDFEN